MKLTINKYAKIQKNAHSFNNNLDQPDLTSLMKKNNSVFDICCGDKNLQTSNPIEMSQQKFIINQRQSKNLAQNTFDYASKSVQNTSKQSRRYSLPQNNNRLKQQNNNLNHLTYTQNQQFKQSINHNLQSHFKNFQKTRTNLFYDKRQSIYSNKVLLGGASSRRYSQSFKNFMPNSRRYSIQKTSPNTILIKKLEYQKNYQPTILNLKKQPINNKQESNSNIGKVIQSNIKGCLQYKLKNQDKKLNFEQFKSISTGTPIQMIKKYDEKKYIQKSNEIVYIKRQIPDKIQDVHLSHSEVREVKTPEDIVNKINKIDEITLNNKKLNPQISN